MDNKKYKLKTLDDVYTQIPKDRRKAFLDDFALWLEWRDEAQPALVEAMNAIAEAMGITPDIAEIQASQVDVMHWVDDDKAGYVKVEISEQIVGGK